MGVASVTDRPPGLLDGVSDWVPDHLPGGPEPIESGPGFRIL